MRKAISIQDVISKLGRLFIHLLVWAFLILQCNTLDWQWQFYTSAGQEPNFFWPSIYGMFFNALVVYIHALWLYPQRKIHRLPYWLSVLLLLLTTSFVEACFDHWYCNFEENKMYLELLAEMQQEGMPESVAKNVLIVGIAIENLGVHILFWLLSFAFILPRQLTYNQKIRERIQGEKVRAELQFLKAQINPHFLFNGLNSIYHLIDRSPAQAKDITLQFSSLLRYQIYECEEEQIPVEKELNYLKSYFALERVRRGTDAKIELILPDPIEVQELQIAPLLFTPFIENAFKYLSHHEDGAKNRLKTQIDRNEEGLYLHIENTVDEDHEYHIQKEASGVGLTNVKKRLALLYPGQHQLIINPQAGRFSVTLQIDMK